MIKSSLQKLPLNGKVMSVDKVEKLTEFLDSAMSKQTKGEALVQTSFGPASQQILGILNDMRGEYLGKLQAAQITEKDASVAHANYVKRARKLIENLKADKADREAGLADEKAAMEQNTADRDAA